MMNEDKKLNIGIEEIKKIKMTSDEKKRILENVLNFPIPSHAPLESPYVFSSFVSVFRKRHFVYYGMMILAIAVFSGGGVVYASQNSLPGSVFFPIKVKVIEPIHSALLFSPKAKAQYESELAMERLVEAETLVDQGKFDKEKEKELNGLLVDHTIAFNEAVKKAEEEKSSESTDEIVSNFHEGMDTHAQILDVILEKENVVEENITDQNTMNQNPAEENAPEQKKEEREDEEVNISKTAHENAQNTEDHYNDERENNGQKEEDH